MRKGKIPRRLQSVLWSADIDKLDLGKDKNYIIHQTLMRGSFDDLKWLFKTYTKQQIRTEFYQQPAKIYPKKVYFFIKNYVLDLKDKNIDDQNYITSIFGPTRPRATRQFSSKYCTPNK